MPMALADAAIPDDCSVKHQSYVSRIIGEADVSVCVAFAGSSACLGFGGKTACTCCNGRAKRFDSCLGGSLHHFQCQLVKVGGFDNRAELTCAQRFFGFEAHFDMATRPATNMGCVQPSVNFKTLTPPLPPRQLHNLAPAVLPALVRI